MTVTAYARAMPRLKKIRAEEPAPKDPFAVEIGQRIELACSLMFGNPKRAHLASVAAKRETALTDYDKLTKWCRGDRVLHLTSLVEISLLCAASLDWLVFGTENNPDLFDEWVATRAKKPASKEAQRALRDLTALGRRVGPWFYDAALDAWNAGLRGEELQRAVVETVRRG